MNIYTIYKAVNKTNGKVYIGFDSNWPSRQKKHKNKYQKLNIVFYDSIKKYGWDNFEWEIIYQSLDGKHTLEVMENYFINEYRSFVGFNDCHGYNMTLGGEGVLGLSGERSPWYKRKHTEYSKKLMSEKAIGKRNRKQTEETKLKIGIASTGRLSTQLKKDKISRANSKTYYFYNPSGLKIEIENLKKFCVNNDLSYGCMRQLIKGKSKQHKGWKYYL